VENAEPPSGGSAEQTEQGERRAVSSCALHLLLARELALARV
jgi:hypothetical protein